MDTNTKSKISFVIDFLKDDLAHAQSELSRLDYVDEAAAAPGNRNPPQAPNNRFGVVNLPIHYTLGRGLSGALGDHVQDAVLKAFREGTAAGDNLHEIDFCGIGMLIDLYWDKENQCVCLHLELVHTDEHISMDEFGAELGGGCRKAAH